MEKSLKFACIALCILAIFIGLHNILIVLSARTIDSLWHLIPGIISLVAGLSILKVIIRTRNSDE